jgi:DNA-binding response OmpR family regulator
MKKKKILVVDDEEDLCEILSFNLKSAGFETDVAYSAEEAYSKLKNNYDLLLLDVMMGAISGFKLAELIREEYPKNIPIIFITAKDQESDKLKGFNIGADDYISKPFSIKEVIARVKAVLSRTTAEENNSKVSKKISDSGIEFRSMSINLVNKIVTIEGREIKLTKKEFEILYMLAGQPLKIFSRAQILDSVWQNESYVLDRTIDVHIARLRKKIEPYSSSIVNRSGYGYCFDPGEEG